MSESTQKSCPCGGGVRAQCCGPYLAGEQNAPTAVQLMRSRYTAFVEKDAPYLLKTWHPSSRPEELGLDEQGDIQWLGLAVERCENGLAGESKGVVEFTARYQVAGQEQDLHEVSRFVFENEQWFYVDGDTSAKKLVVREKIGRNQPCPCGSGKKYKRCCMNK